MLLLYALLKTLHVSAIAISGLGFVLRYALLAPGRARPAWVRVGPHVVDTVLLVSAIALACLQQASPLALPWLAAKIVALPLYIGLGTIALKRGRLPRQRAVAFVAALACYAYIVSVALTRNPWGFFGVFFA
ncbi:MAG TPA: SirB2 family protein [Burkholderiaceae bacterium]|nr:SirB2 family protein [Burkholderiaceae bacterium]